ncbi:MAG TPA: two-component regulator propeller domain-containing protein [Thermoanaerobaculia bacterium]|nr:two-component regulator propeller domain-containing protein [Thermoanaerobaculia bacterium]HUM31271.1 two-component regulator propeller domain-containing protein [Thermoanaerobaculia bacterium]HXK69625.1 two-component regulator propeller domain-containing protein [Thermoanaerobaculia bacterium]
MAIYLKVRVSRLYLLCALSMLAFPLTVHGGECVYATEVKFEHISLDEGLSQTTARALLKDSRGFMWFGTEDGLNMYDGYSFVVYRPDPGDLSTISSNFIRCLHEDSSGNIWIGTNGGGLNRLDRSTGKFTRYHADPDNPATLSNDYVWTILEDPTGALWLGTDGGGLNRFDPETETFTRYRHDPDRPGSLVQDNVLSLCLDHAGFLWIGTRTGGLSILAPDQMDSPAPEFINLLHDPTNPTSLSSNEIWTIHEDKAMNLWIGTRDGGICMLKADREDLANPNFTCYQNRPGDPTSLSHNRVLCIIDDPEGNLWIGTEGGGLNRLDPATGIFTAYKRDPSNPDSLNNNYVFSLLMDREGTLWIGTEMGGINKLDPRYIKFYHFANDPNNERSLSNNSVWAMLQDREDTFWVGTREGGLNRYDTRQKRFDHFVHNPEVPASLSDDYIRKIFEDSRGNLWIGTDTGGLERFDRKRGTFTHLSHNPVDPSSISSDRIYDIFEDSQGTLWIATRTGGVNQLKSVDPPVFTHFMHDPADADTINDNFIYKIYEDRNGVLWFGTFSAGLDRYNRESGRFTHYTHDPNNPKSLSHNVVLTIFQDSRGTLWVGTGGGGINKFNPEDETFTYYLEEDGLANEVVYGVLEDSKGYLWISTNNGLSRFDPEKETFKNFGMADGLLSKEYNGGAYMLSRSGYMFFGGINGIDYFDPTTIQDNPFVPPVYITSFQLARSTTNGEPHDYLPRPVTELEEITLTHRDNIFSIGFVALNYTTPEKNRYAYMLEGFNDDWIQADASYRYAHYTNLDPGTYYFRVRGSNNDGVWNMDGDTLKITILPPWWQTTWAYLLYLLTGALLAYAVIRFVKMREREKTRLHVSELKARTKEAEAKVLRVENERKTLELEGARQLQRSMLPDTVPRDPRYSIAVSMKPATEVGGDYYDFHVGKDGTLTIALGDATGHGMQAGIMVAIMKGLFSTLYNEPDIAVFFARCNTIINNMNLQSMWMALTLVKMKDHKVSISSAAMPPVFHYRAAAGTVHMIELKGMFLGVDRELDHKRDHREIQLEPGDKLLLMTDGLAEMENTEEEMLDLHRCQTYFQEVAAQSPGAIIQHLFDRGAEWRGTAPQEDDITLIVLEATNQ